MIISVIYMVNNLILSISANSSCSGLLNLFIQFRIHSGHDPLFHKGPANLATVGVYSCYCTIIINLVQWSIYSSGVI